MRVSIEADFEFGALGIMARESVDEVKAAFAKGELHPYLRNWETGESLLYVEGLAIDIPFCIPTEVGCRKLPIGPYL